MLLLKKADPCLPGLCSPPGPDPSATARSNDSKVSSQIKRLLSHLSFEGTSPVLSYQSQPRRPSLRIHVHAFITFFPSPISPLPYGHGTTRRPVPHLGLSSRNFIAPSCLTKIVTLTPPKSYFFLIGREGALYFLLQYKGYQAFPQTEFN